MDVLLEPVSDNLSGFAFQFLIIILLMLMIIYIIHNYVLDLNFLSQKKENFILNDDNESSQSDGDESSNDHSDSSSESSSENCEFVLSKFKTVPKPNKSTLDKSLGSGGISKGIPQVWTSQGKNLIRVNNCDTYIH